MVKRRKSKETRISFAKIKEELNINTGGDETSPVFLDQNDPDRKPFRWVFLQDCMCLNHADFGWKRYTKNKLPTGVGFEGFLTEIEKEIHDRYSSKTFGEVSKMPHCGFFRQTGLTEAQINFIRQYFPKQDGILEQIYHILINQKHRLYGYISNGMFYIVFNDPKHLFNNLK